jgi:putative hemolysin
MLEILIILGLILLNGLFSMSEIALLSARKARLESQANKGDAEAKAALTLANHPDSFLSTVQIGITLIGILTGIFSG